MKSLLQFVLITMLASSLLAFTFSQKKPWPVPDKFSKMANPVANDAASAKSGKALWAKHCQSCHGKMGLGDGNKAAQLKTAMDELGSEGVQKQTDGQLFYKISEGRDEMPSFKKKIPSEDEIWTLVNYVRSFKN